MLFADTSFLAASLRVNDENHLRAKEIAGDINEKMMISDHVFSELLTLMAYKEGNKEAYRAGKRLLDSEVLIVYAVSEDFLPALEMVRTTQKLSMCDALSATIMRKLGVKKILSFDSDFDLLGFERIC
ncbi:MAG: PIN domain-containing protein [Candidatus Micrarchaeota archaeon]|nr:PIN domain-containing protein [Candidatus Micrarchaeota archaeon]